MRSSILSRVLFLSILTGYLSHEIYAVDRTFNSSGTDWFTASHWGTGAVPGLGDTAIVGVWSADKSITFGTGTSTISQLTIGNTSNAGNITIGGTAGQGVIQIGNGSGVGFITKRNFKWDIVNPLVVIASNTTYQGSGTWDATAGLHGSLTLAGGLKINQNIVFTKQAADTPLFVGGNLTMEDNSFINRNANGHMYFQGQLNVIKGGILHGVHNSNFQGANFIFTGEGRDGQYVIDPDFGDYQLPGWGLTVNSGEVRFGYGETAKITNAANAALNPTATTATNVYFATQLIQTNGTINIGDSTNSTDAGTQARRTANFVIHAKNLVKGNGTLRLQYGTGNGTTTLLGGDVITKSVTAPTGSSVTVASTAGLVEGMRVYGPGIADDTYISTISGGTVTFNKALGNSALVGELMFAQGVHNQTASGSANANTITVVNGGKFTIGQTITGTGIRTGTTITGISGNTLTLDSTLTQSISNVAVKSYAPETIRFGGSSIGNIGATVEVLRGVSAQGQAYGRVIFDPSLRLHLEGRGYVNFSDNNGTYENFIFKSIHSDNSGAMDGNLVNQTHQNQLGNIKKVAGSPFIVFESGYTNIINGSEIAGPGIAPGSRVIGIYANAVLLDKPVTITASGTGSTVLIRNHTSLISDAGNAKLTIGNYSDVNDIYDGRLHFSSSGAESMLVKVGSNTLTLSGLVDNSGSRFRVDEGTLVLAKESTPYVRNVGSNLIIGDDDASFEIVRLAGSFNSSVTHQKYSNYNEQIYGSARVEVKATGFLDLNGFSEGIGYLHNTKGTVGGYIGNTSSQDATLILGTRTDQSYNTGTNASTSNPSLDADSHVVIQDGGWTNNGTAVTGGKVNLEYTGGGTMYLRGRSTYTGYTHVARGNLTLRGSNATFSNTSSIRITNGTFFLHNHDGMEANQNRLNDAAPIIMRNGTFTINNVPGVSGNTNSGNRVTERVGSIVMDGGHNIIRLQHDANYVSGTTTNYYRNEMRLIIDQLIYKNGTALSIVENIDSRGDNNTKGIGFSWRGTDGWTRYYGANQDTNRIMPNQAIDTVQILNPSTATLMGGVKLDRAKTQIAGQGTPGDPSDDTFVTTNTYRYDTKNLKILKGVAGGQSANWTRDFMTIDSIWEEVTPGVYAENHYIRPLDVLEYYSYESDNVAATVNTNFNDVARFGSNNRRVGNNLAFNSLRYSGATRTNIDLDKVLKIGSGTSIKGFEVAGHDAAGMLNLIDWGGRIHGGTLDFGGQEIWIRGQGATTISANLVSSFTPDPATGDITGFLKHGGAALDLWGNNQFNGESYVVQGGVRAYHSGALGEGGALNGIRLVTSGYDGDTLALSNGVILGDLNDPNKKKNVILEFDARLSAFDQNNSLAGDVIVASSTEVGRPITSYLRTRRHSAILTIEGNVYGINPFDPTNNYRGAITEELGANQAGRVLAMIGDNRNDGIINVTGKLSDYAVDGVPTYAMNEKDRMILLVRGGTGDAGRAAPINDFHVNVNNMEDLSGYLDLRSGWLRSQSSYGTGVMDPNAVGGAAHSMVMRLRDNSSQNPFQMAALTFTNQAASRPGYEPINPVDMSKGGAPQYAHVNQITWTDGDGGYSASSYGMIVNEGKGRLIVGNGYGTLDMNPAADIAFNSAGNYYYRSPPQYDEDGNLINDNLPVIKATSIDLGAVGEFDNGFGIGNISVGMMVSGTGVPEGAIVKAISGTTVSFWNPNLSGTVKDVEVTLTPDSSITFSEPQFITMATGTRHPDYTSIMVLGSFAETGIDYRNIRPGTLLTGTGVPNSTYVMQVLAPGTVYRANGVDLVTAPNGAVLLNNALTSASPGSVIFNDAIPNSTASQRYADARLYAALGGEIDLRLRVLDDGGFGLENEAGAITKVGRGYGRLSGVPGAVGELDGGLNLHGGTLILDYRVNPGRKVTSGDNHQAPLTLSGGNLWVLGNATNTVDGPDVPFPSATTEQLRGIIFVRPGASTIRVTSGGIHDTRLDLGVPNNLAGGFDMGPVVYAGGAFNFWKDQAAGGTAIITMNLTSTQRNQPLPYAVYTNPQTGKVTEFAYFAVQTGANSLNYVEGSLGSSAGNTHFGVTNMANTPSTTMGSTGFGYIREQAAGDGQPAADGVGFYGTLQAGKHLRAVIFNQQNVQGTNATSGSFKNGVVNLAGPTLLLNPEQTNVNGGNSNSGGAILVTSGIGSSNKTIQGGSLSSTFKTKVWNPRFRELEESTYSLYIHNYADPGAGMLILNTDLADPGKVNARDTNNNPIQHSDVATLEFGAIPDRAMNLVHSGTGTTKMARAYDGGAGYSYTGSTFLNGGSVWSKSEGSELFDIETVAPATLWVSDPNKLGANPTSFDADNIYFNGGRLRLVSMTVTNSDGTEGSTLADNIASKTITLNGNRGITIGGQGGYIDVAAAGTTFVVNSPIATEAHSPTFAGGQIRSSNIGVGDLIKEGAGTLVLTHLESTYSGITDIQAGKVIVKIDGSANRIALTDPNAYVTGDNQFKNNAGALGSSYSYIDGTFVNTNAELRFEVTGTPANDFTNRRVRMGSAEYITLDGGTLGTTSAHNLGALEGMIRVRQNSTIDVVGDVGKVLRLNSYAGMMTSEGAEVNPVTGALVSGHLTKTGLGTLEVWENNTTFRGNWTVKEGRLHAMSQGRPLGNGALLTIGDTSKTGASTGEVVEVLQGSRQAHSFRVEYAKVLPAATGSNSSTIDLIIGDSAGITPGMTYRFLDASTGVALTGTGTTGTVYQNETATRIRMSNVAGPNAYEGILELTHTAEMPMEYNITQNIIIEASNQKKVIGAANHQTLENTGMNWDRYNFDGEMLLNDDVYLSYKDNVNNLSLTRTRPITGEGGTTTGRDQVIAFNGDIHGTKNMLTEIEYTGDTTATDRTDLRIYFELNGSNTNWTGALNVGNGLEGNADRDRNHIVRFGTKLAATKNSSAIGATNDVYLTSNATLQTGGKNVTIGNLRVAQLNADGSSTNLAVGSGTGATTGAQSIVIENASDETGEITITQEESADWNVLFRDGTTDPHYITNVNNRTAAQRNKSLSVVKAGGEEYQLLQAYDGSEVGIAVMTQNNTYTGTTMVAAGNLQVGRAGIGMTGTGATTVMAGAALSGTGRINGTANTTNHILNGIMRPGDQGGASRGILTIDGNLTTQSNTSNISFNIRNATKNKDDMSAIGLNHYALDIRSENATTYNSALNTIATNWGNAAVNGANHDHVKINGKFTLGGDTTVQVIGDEDVTYEIGDVYNLLDWTTVDATTFSTGGNRIKGGSLLSGSDDLILPELTGDLWWDTSKFLSHGLLVVVGVVPEPSKGVLVMLALGALVLRRRRAA